MAAKTAEEKAAAAAQKAEEKAAAAASSDAGDEKSSGKDVATVTWRGNVREYSKEVHGADFKKLAAQFAEKFNGTVA